MNVTFQIKFVMYIFCGKQRWLSFKLPGMLGVFFGYLKDDIDLNAEFES